MHESIIKTGVFETGVDRPRGEAFIKRLLVFLVRCNLDDFTLRRRPALYQSGVRYRRDPDWLDAFALLEYGEGDCKSLSAYRLAELIASGEDPAARLLVTGGPLARGGGRYHVRILRSDGLIEDPSRRLGMP